MYVCIIIYAKQKEMFPKILRKFTFHFAPFIGGKGVYCLNNECLKNDLTAYRSFTNIIKKIFNTILRIILFYLKGYVHNIAVYLSLRT